MVCICSLVSFHLTFGKTKRKEGKEFCQKIHYFNRFCFWMTNDLSKHRVFPIQPTLAQNILTMFPLLEF